MPCTTYTVKQNDVDDTMQDTLITAKPGHRTHQAIEKLKVKSALTATPENNTRGSGEQMHISNEVTQRCSQRYASPTSKYKFSERYESVEGEFDVKLDTKDVEVGTSANGNPTQNPIE